MGNHRLVNIFLLKKRKMIKTECNVMLEKMKAKMIFMSIMIAVVAGMVTGGTLWMCENGKCMCQKAKKMFKKMTDAV